MKLYFYISTVMKLFRKIYMKLLFCLLGISAISFLTISCALCVRPMDDDGPDTTRVERDTIQGWVGAGLQFIDDDSGGIQNLKLVGNNLYCRTLRGVLYRNTIGTTVWEPLQPPDNKRFWCMDVWENILLLGSFDGYVYEYDCIGNSFALISPGDLNFWADTVPTDSFCIISEVLFCNNYIYANFPFILNN